MTSILKDPAAWLLGVVFAALAALVYAGFAQPPEQPAKFSTECISEGVMVVKSDKTQQFDVFYSENCK